MTSIKHCIQLLLTAVLVKGLINGDHWGTAASAHALNFFE
jgi:hypothetical protein